jgi:L-ascorbate metabolism protein UlaG (beta-lactamase superfamily)
MLAALAACSGGWHGPVTDHFDGSRFHNNPPTEANSLWDIVRWQWQRPADDWVDRSLPAAPAPAQRIVDGRLVVTFVNHATVLIQQRGLNILTDPNWSDHAGPFGRFGPRRHTPAAIAFDALPPIDVILMSHDHYDHFDMPTLRRLAQRDPGALVLAGLGNGARLREAGFTHVREMDWWDSAAVANGMRVSAVPMRHWTKRLLLDANDSLWEGFVIESADGPVLFCGDTASGPHFEEIRRRFGRMRLALLPIGAYEPKWFMSKSHMSPAEAVDAFVTLQAQDAMAIHFGTFRLADEGQFAPVEALGAARRAHNLPDDVFRALDPGGTWEVPRAAR